VMLGSMPARVREIYELEWTRRHELAFRAVVRGVRATLPLVPGAVRRGYNTRSFDMVALTERRRIEQGKPTPQLRDDGPATARRVRERERRAA
jgi:uncharacterized protein (DUF2236 family)